jgi:hypothetical protein
VPYRLVRDANAVVVLWLNGDTPDARTTSHLIPSSTAPVVIDTYCDRCEADVMRHAYAGFPKRRRNCGKRKNQITGEIKHEH